MATINKPGAEASQPPAYLDDPADLLNPEELAERLKVPKSWIFEQTRVRAKIRNPNPLPCIRLGRYVVFSWTAVAEWMASLPNGLLLKKK
jgi:hypothetical protein